MRILKFISSLLLLILLSDSLSAQNTGSRIRGPRIGYDLASLALLYTDPGRRTYNFSIDYEAWQDIYPVLEFGFQTVQLEHDNYSYGSDGMYARMGVDVNLMKYDQPNVYEMFYAGFRYGISYLTHQADNIDVKGDYFADLNDAGVPENQVNAHFVSVAGGIRVELFDNVFMGWTVLFNIKLAQIEDVNMQPYYIPGFGKGDKRGSIVFNYTIAYRIPMQRYHPVKIIKKKEDLPDQK